MPDSRSSRVRLAILSFSTAEYDVRSLRVARSAVDAGYEVTLYARWAPGLAVAEEGDGYRIVRVDSDWRLALPWLRRSARARRQAAEAAPARVAGSPSDQTHPQPTPATFAESRLERGPSAPEASQRWILPLGRMRPKLRDWWSIVSAFPLRPIGWSIALAEIAEPAAIWHGMWAGSLPALVRLRRRHGGRAIYDSRDIYMLSRKLYRLGWPLHGALAALERRWAHQVDRVITVNEACADVIARQLRVDRPAVVLNTPPRWTPPTPPPDRIRQALGLDPDVRVVLYQGQLISERGIEQAADAVTTMPRTVLVLLGYGSEELRYRALSREAPYAGRVFCLPAVPPAELLAWTASSDVVVMAIQPSSTNHELATPQKLWEALAAGVPVVASDLPGMAAVVRETGAGELCDPTSPVSIAEALRRVLDAAPEARDARRARALQAAHDRYNWESQAIVLLGVYADLLGLAADDPRRLG